MREMNHAAPRRHILSSAVSGLLALAAFIATTGSTEADTIKVGTLRVAAFAPVFVVQEKGYFAAEGVPAEIVYFDAAQPVAVATVSGAIDFGIAALTGGFYNLASQGALKIIAAANREFPGFQTQAFIVSSKAYASGLRSLVDLPGHSFAVTGLGAPPVYVVGGILAEKYGFDFKTIRLVSLTTMPNINTAVAGGQVDFTITSLLGAMAGFVERQQVHLIGWVGDEAPWQFGVAFTATKTANERQDTVEKFLRAYRKGARTYHDAFTGAGETREDEPTASALLAILAKYTDQSVEDVARGLPYIDAEARIDVKNIRHQINWYKSQGIMKDPVDGAALIDTRYATALP